MIILIAILIIMLIVLAVMWEKGITYMHENYPDYKGEDLCGDDEDK